MTTVYAVASAKGGVGKTTTTANLAALLADAGSDVVAVDADIGMANLAGALGVDVAETTIHDVLAGRSEPDAAVHEGPAGLRVVPGRTDLEAYAEADPAGIRGVIDAFDDADYVFVDCGAGLSHDSALPLGLADETLLVSTAERDALGDTEKTRQLTERLGGRVAGVALTRVDPDADTTGLDGLIDADVLGRIPEDRAVARALRDGEPLVVSAPHAPATAAYRALGETLTGEALPEPAAPAGETVGDPDEPEAGDSADASTEPVETGTEDAGTEEAVPEDGTDDEDGVVDAEPPESGDDGDRVDVPDEDAAGAGEPETDPEAAIAEAEPDRESEPSTDDVDADDDVEDEADEEPPESVPFAGDDAGPDGDRGSDDTGSDPDTAPAGRKDDADDATGADDANGADDTGKEKEEKKGFFSRLLGR